MATPCYVKGWAWCTSPLGLGFATVYLLLVAFPAPPAFPAPLTQLPQSVRDILHQAKIPEHRLSVWVQDLALPHPLLAVHAQQARNPASVIKLLTTIVGLEMLGPAYQFRTEAYIDGPLSAGRVQGNLILKGYGDPGLVTEAFWSFVRALRNRGIRHIDGDLIIDNSFFTTAEASAGAFDGKPHRVYNALPKALLLNFQATQFRFSPDAQTRKIRIIPHPRQTNLHIDNHLELVTGRCRGKHYRTQMQVTPNQTGSRVRFGGDYPLACGVAVIHRVVQPSVLHLFGAFDALWQEMGGTLSGGSREGRVPERARRVLVYRSRPLAELIRGMNKFSNNVMTRQLLLTIAAERSGAPGTLEHGRAAIRTWLQRNHIQATGLVVENGAGLSRQARITATTLAQVLRRASTSLYMPEFLASLPLVGQDGTMRRRFKGDALAGRARIKTGTLAAVRAMGGYVLSRPGGQWIVVALLNHPHAPGRWGRAVQDALLQWVFRQANKG
ncbi:MAG: D-alanyl-D-alanine carboxypeptidase/D-alanyl-D-alanine-endopeptidase [Candidatus Tectomicrobia bacterium]